LKNVRNQPGQGAAQVPLVPEEGLEYELDALANKDFRYLTKTYLPRKRPR